MPYTQAQKKASRKYNENNYDRLYITVSKGKKDIIRQKAESVGMSINEYVVRLIDDSIR